MTPLDTAHARMDAAPEDDAARMAYYDRLATVEIFVLLETESDGDHISPQVFETGDGMLALAFDTPDRLVAFADGPAPYAAISGRVLSGLLAPQKLGLGINLGVAPSAIVIPAHAVVWLHDTLAQRPEELHLKARDILPPGGLPDGLVAALDARLAAAKGLARLAYLAATRFETGASGHLLAFIDAVPEAHGALAGSVNEALIFSGIEAGALDVTFLDAADPVAAKLARVALRFDLPQATASTMPAAPGRDPDHPPKLR